MEGGKGKGKEWEGKGGEGRGGKGGRERGWKRKGEEGMCMCLRRNKCQSKEEETSNSVRCYKQPYW